MPQATAWQAEMWTVNSWLKSPGQFVPEVKILTLGHSTGEFQFSWAPQYMPLSANQHSSQWKNRKGGFDHADRSVLDGFSRGNRVLDSIGSLNPILSTAESSACQVISASRKLSLFGLWNQVGHGEIPGQLQRDIWCLPYNKSQLGMIYEYLSRPLRW